MVGICIRGCRSRSTPGYNLSSLSGCKETASPENMREDAVLHSLSFQPGLKMARVCFANAR
jgi:hypothetical protein